MSYTLIDYTKGFHILSKQVNLSAGTRSTFTAIIGEFNAAYFPERLKISDRDLKTMAGLKSVASVHECKNVLKNHGLIDFTTKSGRRGTSEYRLATEWLANIQPNIQPNINRTFDAVANIGVREDVKDVEDNLLVNYSIRARNVNKLDELINYWSKEIGGGRLTFEHQSKLEVFAEKYGVEWVKSAMDEAANINHDRHGIKPKLLFAILENKAKPKQQLRLLKGGERVGQSDSGTKYKEPVYTGNEDWANY